ncbi:MAG: hypothetical protein DI582_09905 [Azospirillum brasilense]|nr:MAG: hypothetical protein DI582_09905 [Azospirillum brasilense]
MADLTTTQLKLRTTPTAGVSSEQSPYYRRLLSAGYKGFLQGTVGGSTLYGTIGAGIGALVALPLTLVAGPAAFALIPAMGGLGLYKGASTFGNIGSFAAITAESAEMSEKRRYLLDRYYDLPDTPEFDAEANMIKDLLAKQHESKPPAHMFHLRPVLVGAALGVGAALLLMTPVGMAFAGHFVFEALGAAATTEAFGFGFAHALAAGVGAALGGASGAVMGLDRFYVRSWLDKSAMAMHDTKSIEEQVRAHEQEIAALGATAPTQQTLQNTPVTEIKEILPETPVPATKDTASMKINVTEPTQAPAQKDVAESHPHPATPRGVPISPRVIAGLDEVPSTVANSVQHEGPLHQRQIATAV